MPLADYIQDFIHTDIPAQIRKISAGDYTKDQLESLQRHTDADPVMRAIDTMLNHGELDLDQAADPISHDDLVFDDQKICRYYGNSTPPAIKYLTDNGGWASVKDDLLFWENELETKEEVDECWQWLWENRSTDCSIEKRGCQLVVVADEGEIAYDEAVTPMPIEKSNTTSMSVLDAAGVLNDEFARFQTLEKQTVESALKLGVGLLQAKQELPHGQFGAFMRDHITFSERHGQRFMKLAKTFLHALPKNQQQHLLSSHQWESELEAVADEFIGGRNQMELFADFGITSSKQPAKTEKPEPLPLPPGETTEHLDAVNTWSDLVEGINTWGLKNETWAHLNRDERQGLYDLVHELDNRLKASLKGGD